MVDTVNHFKIPFLHNLGMPQNIYVRFRDTMYQVWYRKNSYDDSLIIELYDPTSARLLFVGKMVENGPSLIKDEHYLTLFVLFCKDPNLDNPDIWALIKENVEEAIA